MTAPSAPPVAPDLSGSSPPTASAAVERASALGQVAGSLLSQSGSTPGKLRSRSLIILVLALLTGLLASFTINQRKNTVEQIRDESEPLIVAARSIQAELAEADAAASNAFLAGGIENADQRRKYEGALDRATVQLATAARLSGDDTESQDAVVAMEQAVSKYAGLVETARVNNRLGHPVGAAYLNNGSQLLREEVYPRTDDLANRSAANYRNDYNGLMSTGLVWVALTFLAGLALLLVLLWVQWFIRKRFNRLVNVPLALATVGTLALLAWLTVALVGQGANLQTARLDGYDGVRDYVDARALGYRAKGAESRFLIARGGGNEAEFDVDADRLLDDDDAGLLVDAREAAESSERQLANAMIDEWSNYRAVHRQVVDPETPPDEAERLALDDANDAFDGFADAALAGLDANQRQFERAMNSARAAVSGLTFGSIALAVLIAVLSFLGIQQRINEYR